MRRFGFVGAGIALAVFILSMPASLEPCLAEAPAGGGARAAGRLEGTVEVGRQVTARRARLRLYSEPNQAGFVPPRPAPDTELRNVVIYIASSAASGAPAAAAGPFVMRQEGQSFEPHILVVPTGATVEFPNVDPVFHNVFSLSKAKSFDLGHYPKGASKAVVFDRAGIVKVYCHLHADMGAVILVVDNPFHASPDDSGRFWIEGIPAGEYDVVAWHERATPITRRLRIEPGGTTTASFQIPLLDAAAGE